MNPLFEALFAADHIAAKGSIAAIPAPGVPGTKVYVEDLATKLLAYAFFSANESGALNISLGSKKVLFITNKFVVVKRGPQPIETESKMLNGLFTNAADGKTVHDAVYAWFREEQDNPHAIVVQNALDEAVAAGYMIPAKQTVTGTISQLFGGISKAEPVPEKTDEIAVIRQTGVQRWDTWAADKALVTEVLKQCSSALGQRKKSNSLDNTLDRIDAMSDS